MKIINADCRAAMQNMAAESFDSIVTDPPYGLSFMGKGWDHGVPGVEFWTEALRVAKPGAHLLAFGGTRTFHRLACAIEDAGWEIRDCVMWVYGSGFPKSADVSKMLDKHEQKKWIDVCKALDNADQSAILAAWKDYSKTARDAGLLFRKSETVTGTNMQKSGSVPANVRLQVNLENSYASAVIAELSLTEAHLTGEASCSFVQSVVESITTGSRSPAINAESQPANHGATLAMPDFSAPQSAWGWHGESTVDKLKAVEALKTWLGSRPSSSKANSAALCAALTEDLKHIILSQSKTFQSFDMTRQMDCAFAISVTITESTAANLISFTADTLRSKAIDKAAGAQREVVGATLYADGKGHAPSAIHYGEEAPPPLSGAERTITAPATDAAKQWQGWGTALKPAWEPITVARKPLIGTVAENVLEHGTGALNIDGCRVEAPEGLSSGGVNNNEGTGWGMGPVRSDPHPAGRWPANVIHDGSDEVVGLFPETGSGNGKGAYCYSGREYNNKETSMFNGDKPQSPSNFNDSGSAARFFYCAKASKADRGSDNHHPTVKPTALMRYLCRLVTPPGGVVLDPFCGSGSTGKAAILEGFDFVGIEQDADYAKIAEARIKHAMSKKAEELPL